MTNAMCDNKVPIHIVTQLWGATYVDLYSNFVLPSLSCDGNLPALRYFNDVVYEIYTTQEDKTLLEQNQNFTRIIQSLKQWMTVRFVIIDQFYENSYLMMSDCHRKAINAAELRSAAIIFLQPDVLVSNNSLSMVKDKIISGVRLVMAPGFRTIREKMQEELAPLIEHSTFPSTQHLVKLAVANIHPISRALICDDGNICTYCSHLYWHIGESSIYARCAHMHPLMVYPTKRNKGFDHTIDWDYFDKASPDVNDWFVPENSDEICLIEMSGLTKFQDSINWKSLSPETLADFLNVATRKSHIKLFSRSYLFKGEEFISNHDWDVRHVEANRLIESALKIHNAFPCNLFRQVRLFIQHYKHRFARFKTVVDKSQSILLKLSYYSLYIPTFYTYKKIQKLRTANQDDSTKKKNRYLSLLNLNALFEGIIRAILYLPFKLVMTIIKIIDTIFRWISIEFRVNEAENKLKYKLNATKMKINEHNKAAVVCYNFLYYCIRFVYRLSKWLNSCSKIELNNQHTQTASRESGGYEPIKKMMNIIHHSVVGVLKCLQAGLWKLHKLIFCNNKINNETNIKKIKE